MRRYAVVFPLLSAVALSCSGDDPALTGTRPQFAVDCPPPPLVITATPSSQTTAPNTSATATFVVTDNCTDGVDVGLTASRSGSVLTVGTPSPSLVSLNSGQSATVTVPYTVGASGSGTVVLGSKPTPSQMSGALAVTVGQGGGGAGIPFGLSGLVVGPTVTPGPWTGAIGCCRDPAQTLQQLKDAKAHGIKMWFYPVGHDSSTGSNGDFDPTKWKRQFDLHQNYYSQYQPYITDGTFQGVLLLDDITRTGWSVSFAELEDIAAYAEARIPVPTAVRQHAASLPAGQYVHVDLAWSQYSARLGDVNAYRQAQIDAGTAKSVGVVFGLNIINGGVRKTSRPPNDPCWPGTEDPNNCNMSPSELRNFGSVLAQYSGNCAFIMWRNDATYLARAGIMDTMNYLAGLARNHPATSCRH